jgi:two-component system chemotaxis sensor kinase CheA
MVNREELQKRLLATFREEAADHIEVLERELRAIVTGARPNGTIPEEQRPRLEVLFRVMHTLKGAARSVRFSEIEHLCQDSEVLLRGIVRGDIALTETNLDTLKQSIESLQELVFVDRARSQTPASPPDQTPSPEKHDVPAARSAAMASTATVSEDISRRSPLPSAPPLAPEEKREAPLSREFESIRVDVGRLDRLVLVAEDLLLPSLVVSDRIRAAKQLMEDVGQLRADFSSTGPSRPQEEKRSRSTVAESLKKIEAGTRRLMFALVEDQRALRASVGELFQEVRQARMVPAASMLAAFPAMVRDICRETGKQAEWRVRDSGVELDRKVIELIKDPLIHLVRNAIDHGIEFPEERESAGKPRRGEITVTISAKEGSRVAIEISDDGRGMSIPALKEAAIRSRNVVTKQAQSLSDDEVLDLAFRAGVSTSPVITSISGLGLGLSIVREQMERIDGKVEVRTVQGKGTTIFLELPGTVASYRGLLVTAGGSKLLWPAEAVERAIGVSKQAAIAGMQSGLISLGSETIPFGQLAAVMGIAAADPAAESRRLLPCVVAKSGPRRAVFLVDGIIGESDVLIKDIPLPLRRVRHISSAGLLSNGEAILVLRASDLLASAQDFRAHLKAPVFSPADRPMRVLVVDDSITTRMMERNLFEAAGYTVTVATDGIDAWSILQTEGVDIVVSDIDMPRMNGFDLTSRIRADTRLSELPVVLVTALESRDDKERGIQIGANAYVLKSSFDQSNLLEIVGRLI